MSATEMPVGPRFEENAHDLAGPLTSKMSASVPDWDAKAERRVLWKVDLLLMPILTFSYGLQFVSRVARVFSASILTDIRLLYLQYDKFVFSSAAVFGMLNDLHLTTPVPGTNLVSTQRYSTAYAPLSFSRASLYSPISVARPPSTGVTSLASFPSPWFCKGCQ